MTNKHVPYPLFPLAIDAENKEAPFTIYAAERMRGLRGVGKINSLEIAERIVEACNNYARVCGELEELKIENATIRTNANDDIEELLGELKEKDKLYQIEMAESESLRAELQQCKEVLGGTEDLLGMYKNANGKCVQDMESLRAQNAALVELLEDIKKDIPKQLHKREGFFTRWLPNPLFERIQAALAKQKEGV